MFYRRLLIAGERNHTVWTLCKEESKKFGLYQLNNLHRTQPKRSIHRRNICAVALASPIALWWSMCSTLRCFATVLNLWFSSWGKILRANESVSTISQLHSRPCSAALDLMNLMSKLALCATRALSEQNSRNSGKVSSIVGCPASKSSVIPVISVILHGTGTPGSMSWWNSSVITPLSI